MSFQAIGLLAGSSEKHRVLMRCAWAAQFLFLNHFYSKILFRWVRVQCVEFLSWVSVHVFVWLFVYCTQRILQIDNNEPMQLNKPNYWDTMEIVLCRMHEIVCFSMHLSSLTGPHLLTICERQAYAISSILVNGIFVCVFVIAQLSRSAMKKRDKVCSNRVLRLSSDF